MFVTSTVTGDLITLFITLSVVIVAYYKWKYQYWKKRNLPYLEPHFPYGNFRGIVERTEHTGVQVKHLYDEIKRRGWKHGGIYGFASPFYIPVDLELLKNILTKDFQYFSDRGVYYNEKGDPLSAHLFNISGVKWRNLRTKLTPTFTSGKMKSMFQTLVDCEINLNKKIELESEKNAPIDIKEVLGCFTTDIIGSCAFGLECNTFENENSPFRIYGRKLFDVPLDRRLKRIFFSRFPSISKNILNLRLIPKDISEFFMKIVKDTVNYREKNNIERKDFMQLLIDLKNNKLAEEGYKHDGTTLTIDEIAAQSFVFFIAGFETSSTTMTFALYELAKNQDIQDRVRNEIRTVLEKHGGKISYDSIQDMKYLDQVVNEALRKHPAASLIPRKCVKDYRVPDTDVIIEKGITVLIPIYAIHHDKEYYPDPEKFDPDRFSEENKSQRHSYTHIPFGEGPRICIGMRFGLMQSKVGLASLLRNFKFTVNPKTQEPLKYKVNSIVLAAKREIWLDAQKV